MIEEKLIHEKIENCLYIHESFSSMFHGMLDWFQTQFEPRFAYKVISTYDKAVQFFKSKKMAKDGNIQTNILPSITLDPNLDFTNEERSGKFLWMFPRLDSHTGRIFAKKINLREQGVTISVMHTRYSGTCDVTFWLSSIYELMDFRSKIIQYCGGTGRWIRPKFFWSNVVLPREIVEFNRPIDDQKLDWSATPLEVIQLSTTNTKEYAIPYPINAIWRLDSLSDGSTKYGADQLTEWRFTATFTWEANIPTFLRLDNYSFHNMKAVPHIHISPTYASQPLLNHVPLVCSLANDDVLRKVIKSNIITTVDNEQLTTDDEGKQVTIYASPFVKLDETQCNHYPNSYMKWDHIVSGKLVDNNYILKNGIPNEKFIYLIDKYDSEIDDINLRNSTGCLCRYDDISSEFFNKISSLHLSTISNFDIKLFKSLKKCVGEDITMDSICKVIYSGKYRSRILNPFDVIDKNSYDVCNYLLDIIQKETKCEFNNDKYKLLNFGETSIIEYNKRETIGKFKNNERSIELTHMVNSEMAKKLAVFVNDREINKSDYEVNSKKIMFGDNVKLAPGAKVDVEYRGLSKILNLELMTNYIMTKSDERDYLVEGKRITIDIPDEYEDEYIECCSYNGQLDRNSDFEIVDKKIIFKFQPMRNKIIQVFANRSYS